MAKVKSSGLRNYVGRLGGSVYYMLKGQNIAREKAPEVSNPRTATQMRQRMQWANLVAMYKCLQPYLGKKAFQDKPASWSDYNAFMSANLGANPVYMTKEMVQNGHAILAPYKVTEGSLPTIEVGFAPTTNVFGTNLFLARQIEDSNTVAELTEAIIENNAGWQNGDQLGILVMQNGRAYRPYVHAIEIVLDSKDERSISDVTGVELDFIGATENNYLAVIPSGLPNPTQGLAFACAIIHSRTISGKTSVSTQSLVLNGSAITEYREHITEDAFNAARESYGLPTEVWLDSGYQGETAEPAELALASVAEEVTSDKDPKIEIMTAGSKNNFFDPQTAGDVIGDTFIIFRFNRNHGFADSASVELTYDKGGTQGTSVSYQGTPSIAGNYVRLKVAESAPNAMRDGAITFHLSVDGVKYDLSLTA